MNTLVSLKVRYYFYINREKKKQKCFFLMESFPALQRFSPAAHQLCINFVFAVDIYVMQMKGRRALK